MGTCTDRSREFAEICSFLGAAQRAPLASAASASKPETPEVASLADFHSAASSISQEIFTTSQKLGELTKLVRESSATLFNDPSEKISNYVHSISEDLKRLNGKLESAQAYVDAKKVTMARGGKASQAADHSTSVVGELKSSLVAATKSFKAVVQQRTTNVKAQQERKKEFGGASKQAGGKSKLHLGRPKVYGPSSPGAAPLPRPGGTSAGSGDFPGGGALVARRPAAGQPPHRQQQQQQQLASVHAPLIPDTSYYESRAEAVTEIEAHIVELGAVFGRLGELVQDHQELTERLHENTMTTVENVEAAHQRLLRTLTQLTSNRSVTLKVSGVLFSFIVFFIVFLA